MLTLAVGYQLKLQQEIIENGQRKKIGLWLKEKASSPNDSVYLECLGYIGYYSRLKMLDFPGLSSPEVVEARRMLQTDDYAPLIRLLHPDWLVLRPVEISKINEQLPNFLTAYYEQVTTFDVTEKLDSHPYLPGRPLLEFERVFKIFRIKKTKPA